MHQDPWGSWLCLTDDRGTTDRLAGARSCLQHRDGSADGLILRQQDLLAVMVHAERLPFEQAVRRLRRCHLHAQAAALEQEGETTQRLWKPWREGECAVLQAHATEPGNQRCLGSGLARPCELLPSAC